MSLLSTVSSGRIKQPIFALLYGVDGIGKSTFAAGAPDPIFIGPENGTANLDVTRAPNVHTWEQLILWLSELKTENHKYKTVVIDTLDHVEPMLYRAICAKYNAKSIEQAAGGYGKGYKEALTEWQNFIHLLESLRQAKQMNVVLLAHSAVVQFNDPTTEAAYSRYELKLHESANVSVRALFREKVDMVLFANYVVFSKGEGKEARGVTERERRIWTERSASFDAKNRFNLPYDLPFPQHGAWDVLTKAIDRAEPPSEEKLKTEIMALTKLVKDEATVKKIMELTEGANTVKLGKILAQLREVTKQ